MNSVFKYYCDNFEISLGSIIKKKQFYYYTSEYGKTDYQ
jgi:hypothetical protein